jgi:p-aminobenzoyl-glutamate transporter AbgT
MVKLLWISAATVWGIFAALVTPLWAFAAAAPEIDPTAASGAVSLLVCAVLILVERRTKR